MNTLLSTPLVALNAGLHFFAENIHRAKGMAFPIEWQPPAEGNPQDGWALAEMINHPRIEAANQDAMSRYLQTTPQLIDIQKASDVIVAMSQERLLLHAGPPIQWENMCGPMQGAILGAILLEGWATELSQAENLLKQGKVLLEPAHHHQAVGPMAGIISPSMPIWVVKDQTTGQQSFSNLNEGLGNVLRFGANTESVIKKLQWMNEELAPLLRMALLRSGPIELLPLMAQAIHMGDEGHNRNTAATSLLLKKILPHLITNQPINNTLERVVHFLCNNDHFFLNLSMAACKVMMDAAHNVPYSSIVTAMSRNGINFGIRLSGTGNRWFEAPAQPIEGLFFTGFSREDAAADLGDSAITETAGLGGFAMAASPAIVKFIGGTPMDAMRYTQQMQQITCSNHPGLTIPALNFAPIPAGIDCRKVVDRDVLPVINTGIAHRLPGIGQIGAGITTAPLSCFIQALSHLTQCVKNV